jgi:hypothetical protein
MNETDRQLAILSLQQLALIRVKRGGVNALSDSATTKESLKKATYIPGFIAVAFKDGVTNEQAIALVSSHNLRVECEPQLPLPATFGVSVPNGEESQWIDVFNSVLIVAWADRVGSLRDN